MMKTNMKQETFEELLNATRYAAVVEAQCDEVEEWINCIRASIKLESKDMLDKSYNGLYKAVKALIDLSEEDKIIKSELLDIYRAMEKAARAHALSEHKLANAHLLVAKATAEIVVAKTGRYGKVIDRFTEAFMAAAF